MLADTLTRSLVDVLERPDLRVVAAGLMPELDISLQQPFQLGENLTAGQASPAGRACLKLGNPVFVIRRWHQHFYGRRLNFSGCSMPVQTHVLPVLLRRVLPRCFMVSIQMHPVRFRLNWPYARGMCREARYCLISGTA